LIGPEEIDEVVDTLQSGWLATGPKTRRFEDEFRDYVGAPGALALNSCTAGLHIALLSLGIGAGDEVITTPMTFAATVNVIEHVLARPVMVDVEPDTLNIDPTRVEEALTLRTRAIIPVHYAGHPVDLDPIHELTRQSGISVIEDAAHALPARYRGRFIGSTTNPVAFSFYASKNLTTGEGGMLTADLDILNRARPMSCHGMSRDAWQRSDKSDYWYYEVKLPGFKYNMSDIQASLGLWQLSKLQKAQRRRRKIVEAYNRAFSELEELEIPVERPEVEHAWHLYVLRIRPQRLRIGRDQFIKELLARNIGTSVHFIPVYLHPYYRKKYGYSKEDFPVTYKNYQRMLSLPLNPRLEDRDVADVIEAVVEVVKTYWR
jgi:dTDP-4-amino-4,6-dideoxygalactose transaminase